MDSREQNPYVSPNPIQTPDSIKNVGRVFEFSTRVSMKEVRECIRLELPKYLLFAIIFHFGVAGLYLLLFFSVAEPHESRFQLLLLVPAILIPISAAIIQTRRRFLEPFSKEMHPFQRKTYQVSAFGVTVMPQNPNAVYRWEFFSKAKIGHNVVLLNLKSSNEFCVFGRSTLKSDVEWDDLCEFVSQRVKSKFTI